jgi:hypothetical protein
MADIEQASPVSIWLKLPTSAVALLRSGTVFTSISPRARASEARFGNAGGDPSLRRAGATSIVGKDFLPAIAPKNPLLSRAMGVYKLRDDGIVPLICPTCQNVFADRSKHPCQRPPCYFAWGCFRYFSWKREPRQPLRLSFPLMIAG